jgi:hypothetical protein
MAATTPNSPAMAAGIVIVTTVEVMAVRAS